MPSYNFSNCKNGVEFAVKNNLTFDEALKVLDFEIERLKQGDGEKWKKAHR